MSWDANLFPFAVSDGGCLRCAVVTPVRSIVAEANVDTCAQHAPYHAKTDSGTDTPTFYITSPSDSKT